MARRPGSVVAPGVGGTPVTERGYLHPAQSHERFLSPRSQMSGVSRTGVRQGDAMRTYRCPDCPPDAGEYTAGIRGPLPQYCPAHRRARERLRHRRRRSGRDHGPDDGPTSSASPPEPSREPDTSPSEPALVAIVRADLDAMVSTHPARDSLVALAQQLALAASSPVTMIDARALATVARELRATIRDLVDCGESDDDDLFGDDSDLPTAGIRPTGV
jgi:hypothetical protein